MKKFNKNFIILALLLSAGSIFAALPAIPQQKAWRDVKRTSAVQVKEFKPVFSGQYIVCGNKRVSWDQIGTITVSSSSGVLLKMSPHHVYRKGKKTDWQSFSRRLCQVKAENGKVTWLLKKQLDGKVYDAGTQTMEIMPDGLLRIKCDINLIPAPGWVPYYKNPDIFLFSPFARTDGKNLIFNGRKHKMDSTGKTIVFSGRAKKYHYILSPGNAENQIVLKAAQPEAGVTTCYPDKTNKAFRIVLRMNKKRSCTFTLDLRKGISEQLSPDKRGGVDFKAIENIELPDSSRKNLLQNSSFECGVAGYLDSYHCGSRDRAIDLPLETLWNWTPFESVKDKTAPFGNRVLRINVIPIPNPRDDFRQLCGANITTQMAVVSEGTYTFSCYAKGDKAISPHINVWIPKFFGGHYVAIARKRFDLTDKWQRYSFSFKIPRGWPVEVNINAKGKKRGNVYIDAIQLEKGSKATAYKAVPAEGRLFTSAPDNFVSADEKINGRMLITTAKPNASGTAEIRVKNFFGEELMKKQFRFRSNKSRTAEIALPLDTLPGLGIFLVRADFRMADGSTAFNHLRYSKVKFLDGTHPARTRFGFEYSGVGDADHTFLCHQLLDRYRKVGVGIKYHHYMYAKKLYDLEKKYGIQMASGMLLSYTRKRGVRGLQGFGIVDSDTTLSPGLWDPNKPKWLVKDFYQESNGKITPEYHNKLKNAVKKIVARNKHIPMWLLGGEIQAKFPPEWWSKEKTPEACARVHAKLLKAFAEGVREANPNAKIAQDDPCNMSPNGGIAETERLLRECNKLGFKFDIIAIHPYRFSPESPDLDSDTQTLLNMLDRVGYSKTPVFWPEGMHWGPFNIPQWGTISSSWNGSPLTWPRSLLSYDMSATEKLSASWYVRSYLVLLKYGDRIKGATAGNVLNNCIMDLDLTPYAAQLVPNTLTHILGDAVFKKDIRFAPFIRAYVFEDAKKRPVAAVWCHQDKVDEGRNDAPVAEADFGKILESVTDMMNSPRAFNSGKLRFGISGFPLFLRGKPGTLKKMISALEKANIVSGSGIAPLDILANPQNRKTVRLQVRNYLSQPFTGTLNGKKLTVPGAGKTFVDLPLKNALKDNAVTKIPLDVVIKNNSGNQYRYDLDFEALPARKLPDGATFKTVNWSKLPSVPFTRKMDKTDNTGSFKIGWNKLGLFIESTIKDKNYVHDETIRLPKRWNNDCLQIYIDTLANARVRTAKGYDEDDYDYAVYPNAKGDSSIVYRFRTVEQQLGLATQAPPDHTIAPDIPSSFSYKNGVLTYRIFFPAKYLLPIKLQKGWVFGFALYAADADQKRKLSGALTLATDGKGCFNKPHVWPAVILSE